jgi:membrane fusion protein (multidrug efflux system)
MQKKQASDTTIDAGTTGKKPPFSSSSADKGGDGKSPFNLKTGKRRKPILIGLVVIMVLALVLIVLGVFWIIDSVTYVSTDDASIEAEKATISSKMPGRIKDITVREGQAVQATEKLVFLEDAEVNAQLMVATAQLKSAQVNLDVNEADFTRNKGLFSSGAITQQQYDRALAAYNTALAQYQYAEAQVNSVTTQVANTIITSPIDGKATKPAFQIGDIVQPSQTILTVNNLKNVWVTANFEETKIGRIAVGAEVDITIDKYPGMTFKGTVTSISSGVLPPPFQIGEFTKTTRRIPIRIDFTKMPAGIELQAGLSVEVKARAK